MSNVLNSRIYVGLNFGSIHLLLKMMRKAFNKKKNKTRKIYIYTAIFIVMNLKDQRVNIKLLEYKRESYFIWERKFLRHNIKGKK
jgi:hypothetical protein